MISEKATTMLLRLTKFNKSIDECESFRDKLLLCLCNAHKLEDKPEQFEGIALGEAKGLQQAARQMKAKGFNTAVISEITGLSEAEIEGLD